MFTIQTRSPFLNKSAVSIYFIVSATVIAIVARNGRIMLRKLTEVVKWKGKLQKKSRAGHVSDKSWSGQSV